MHSLSLRFLLLPFTAFFSLSAPAHEVFDQIPICERYLLPQIEEGGFKMEALRRLKNHRVFALHDYLGIRVEKVADRNQVLVQEILPLDRIDRLIGLQEWEFERKQFTFMSAGFKNLESHSREVHRYVLNHVLENRDYNLELRYNRDLRDQMADLRRWRWRLHDAVIGRYRSEKGYLDNSDLFMFRWANELSHNSDVFAVLSSEPRLLATIQISYQGDKNFFNPSLDGFLNTLDLEKSRDLDRLPFEYRLNGPEAVTFRHYFYGLFNREKVCEFTRYAKFAWMPRPVQERMLFEALQAAIKRNMETIVAGGDDKTTRLFARYGFRVFGRMPTRQSQANEYLSYLDLSSKEFKAVYARLEQSARQVEAKVKDDL